MSLAKFRKVSKGNSAPVNPPKELVKENNK